MKRLYKTTRRSPTHKSVARSYYDLLGLPVRANAHDIKRAYYEKARRFHPDGEAPNLELFLRVQRAYTLLSDPHRRRVYDLQLAVRRFNAPDLNRSLLARLLSPFGSFVLWCRLAPSYPYVLGAYLVRVPRRVIKSWVITTVKQTVAKLIRFKKPAAKASKGTFSLNTHIREGLPFNNSFSWETPEELLASLGDTVTIAIPPAYLKAVGKKILALSRITEVDSLEQLSLIQVKGVSSKGNSLLLCVRVEGESPIVLNSFAAELQLALEEIPLRGVLFTRSGLSMNPFFDALFTPNFLLYERQEPLQAASSW